MSKYNFTTKLKICPFISDAIKFLGDQGSDRETIHYANTQVSTYTEAATCIEVLSANTCFFNYLNDIQ